MNLLPGKLVSISLPVAGSKSTNAPIAKQRGFQHLDRVWFLQTWFIDEKKGEEECDYCNYFSHVNISITSSDSSTGWDVISSMASQLLKWVHFYPDRIRRVVNAKTMHRITVFLRFVPKTQNWMFIQCLPPHHSMTGILKCRLLQRLLKNQSETKKLSEQSETWHWLILSCHNITRTTDKINKNHNYFSRPSATKDSKVTQH